MYFQFSAGDHHGTKRHTVWYWWYDPPGYTVFRGPIREIWVESISYRARRSRICPASTHCQDVYISIFNTLTYTTDDFYHLLLPLWDPRRQLKIFGASSTDEHPYQRTIRTMLRPNEHAGGHNFYLCKPLISSVISAILRISVAFKNLSSKI